MPEYGHQQYGQYAHGIVSEPLSPELFTTPPTAWAVVTVVPVSGEAKVLDIPPNGLVVQR